MNTSRFFFFSLMMVSGIILADDAVTSSTFETIVSCVKAPFAWSVAGLNFAANKSMATLDWTAGNTVGILTNKIASYTAADGFLNNHQVGINRALLLTPAAFAVFYKLYNTYVADNSVVTEDQYFETLPADEEDGFEDEYVDMATVNQ